MISNLKMIRKIFVLDTSVILYDHNAIMNFEEHDVAIPIPVLEELDEFKKGSDIKNFEAREFIRLLDKKAQKKKLTDWISLNGEKRGKFRVIMATPGLNVDATEIYGKGKKDHSILNAALFLQEKQPDRPVILVTKDINLRLKAKGLDIHAEDYLTGRVKESNNRFSGRSEHSKFSEKDLQVLFEQKNLNFNSKKISNLKLESNLFYILKSSKKSALAFFNGGSNNMELVEKSNYYGIQPRNSEQAFALHAIMNPSIRLVTLTGVAGTGKTLLALAGSLEQRRDFKQIYLARPIVPLSNRDIGFLPGDAEQKINPYMQPLWDNLKFIKNQFGERDRNYKQIEEMVANEKILVTPLAYIRGRSLSNVIFIVDEAQNLTPHEIKTIITRAGENSKFIFTGDVHQIDTPYLDEQSNGLSYIVDRLRGQSIYAHVTLEKGERSGLANLANDLL
ncbi:MAG: ribonuclease [Owenweeksia sp. TMED14]|nr:MAG: ribonuclease [Owenweeksia sp. TMED14]